MIAKMLAALIDSREEISSVVDVGAGSGRVLQELSVIRPDCNYWELIFGNAPKAWLRRSAGPRTSGTCGTDAGPAARQPLRWTNPSRS